MYPLHPRLALMSLIKQLQIKLAEPPCQSGDRLQQPWRFASAIKELKVVLKKRPRDPVPHENLGDLHLK